MLRDLFIRASIRLLRNRRKDFYIGTGFVKRYTFFEFKGLCSLYLHQIETHEQDRFHTHAFNAWGWTIRGGYQEEVKFGMHQDALRTTKYVGKGLRYIPRLYNHRLLHAQLSGDNQYWLHYLPNGQLAIVQAKHAIEVNGVTPPLFIASNRADLTGDKLHILLARDYVTKTSVAQHADTLLKVVLGDDYKTAMPDVAKRISTSKRLPDHIKNAF